MQKLCVTIFGIIFVISASLSVKAEVDVEMLLNSEVKWSPLNPARGDKSPQAGQLWGDRTKKAPSGFLVKFADGFSSPPHIHNVTYRGVVISGLVHNDDPKAENMWLPAGSFWTQPAGEAHITAAQGQKNIAYIEIEDGPYLVQPIAQAFDNGERPVNVDPTNLVWLNASDVTWVDQVDGVKIAFLWGRPKQKELHGSFIKLPSDFYGTIQNNGTDFRAVVISGEVLYQDSQLDAGSYFGSSEPNINQVSTSLETIIYVRTNGEYKVSN